MKINSKVQPIKKNIDEKKNKIRYFYNSSAGFYNKRYEKIQVLKYAYFLMLYLSLYIEDIVRGTKYRQILDPKIERQITTIIPKNVVYLILDNGGGTGIFYKFLSEFILFMDNRINIGNREFFNSSKHLDEFFDEFYQKLKNIYKIDSTVTTNNDNLNKNTSIEEDAINNTSSNSSNSIDIDVAIATDFQSNFYNMLIYELIYQFLINKIAILEKKGINVKVESIPLFCTEKYYIINDLSYNMIAICQNLAANSNYSAEFADRYRKLKIPNYINAICCDAESLPFRNKSFNFICSFSTLQNLENIYSGIKEIKRSNKLEITISILKKELNLDKFKEILYSEFHDYQIYDSSSLEELELEELELEESDSRVEVEKREALGKKLNKIIKKILENFSDLKFDAENLYQNIKKDILNLEDEFFYLKIKE
ncbi:MAG: methyltransferase domain-containing protein [Promethearchaeota archaeon]